LREYHANTQELFTKLPQAFGATVVCSVAMPHSLRADVVLEHLPAGVVAVDAEGRLAGCNPAAARLLGDMAEHSGARCCDVLGCRRPGSALESRCITEAVRSRRAVVGELLVRTAAGGVWVTGAPLGHDGSVVLHLRPGSSANGHAEERLCIRALGPMRLEIGSAVLEGDWLSHRPGQVLKYLVAMRGRPVGSDELLEAFWPQPGGTPAATNVRQAVHALRQRLEPDRDRQAHSRYVVGRRGGGYELAAGLVVVDADAFVAAAETGLNAVREGDASRALTALGRAAALYRGDFLADEPEADWALAERGRLRALAGRVLRALAGLHVRAGELDAASDHLQRLAELEPLDLDAQRQLLTLLLRRGRRSEAARRYEVVCRRFRRAFGEEPGFELAELARPTAPRFAATARRR
jgi:DNA-binding SARP family transcriptional activator